MLKSAVMALALLVAATPALAQQPAAEKSKTTGFMLGLGLNGTSITFEDEDEADSGGGGTLQVGFGFTPRFTGFIDLSGVVLDGDPGEGEVKLAQAFVGARVQLGSSGQRWRPFLNLGLGAREVTQDNSTNCASSPCDISFSGAAFMFGGGVAFYATRKLAITGAIDWGTGEFTDVTVDNVTVTGFEVDATTTRLNVGLTWFPGR